MTPPDGSAGGAACPVCGGHRITPLLDVGQVPVHSCVQLHSRDRALAYPTGELLLGHCPDCGHVHNLRFDPGLLDYGPDYEETQGYSGAFRAFHRQLAEDLARRHRLRGRRVLEIGCGKGEFLTLLAELGASRCIGFDPGYDPARAPAGQDRIHVVRDFFSMRHADVAADFVCCKMTLEHVARPGPLLAAVAACLRGNPDAAAFFMVPDATRILATGAFEDIYYEHCNYFTPGSMARLCEAAGFVVDGLEILYDGQYLALHAHPAAGDADRARGNAGPGPGDPVAGFADRYARRVALWHERVARWRAGRARLALWGAGSKAVAFLAAVGEAPEQVRVVDINPHRQGVHLPGSGLEVRAPADLRAFRPDVVVALNPVYRPEIAAQLAALDLSPELLTL